MSWRPSRTAAASTREVLPVGSDASRDLVPGWIHAFINRVVELGQRSDGWDSYGARALQYPAVEVTIEFLSLFAYAIQSDPMMSLTTEGGLLLAWQNSAGIVEVVMEPDAEPHVLYEDLLRGVEWDGPVREAILLEKWLWQASSPFPR